MDGPRTRVRGSLPRANICCLDWIRYGLGLKSPTGKNRTQLSRWPNLGRAHNLNSRASHTHPQPNKIRVKRNHGSRNPLWIQSRKVEDRFIYYSFPGKYLFFLETFEQKIIILRDKILSHIPGLSNGR
uniref:Uncharacterized protein n=1 Tax=Salix viminalis TaxID=40686 RepID=A0A6N2NKI9_SALVM